MSFWTRWRKAHEWALEVTSLLHSSLFLLLSQKYIVKWTSDLGLLSPIIHFSSRSFPYLVHHVASKNYQHIWGNDVGRRNTATQVAGYSVLLAKETLSHAQVQLPNSWNWAQNFLTVRLVTTALKPLPFPYSLFLAIKTNQLKSKSSPSFSAARTFSLFPKAGHLISI